MFINYSTYIFICKNIKKFIMRKFTLLKTVLLAVIFIIANGSLFAKDYKLVTSDTELEADASYIIVGIKSGAYYAMGTQNANNRASVAVSAPVTDIITTDIATEATSTLPYEVTLKGVAGTWNLYDGVNATYLRPRTGTSNGLQGNEATADWTIAISENGEARIVCIGAGSTTFDRNTLRFNSANNPPLFACYASGQTAVYLYKEAAISEDQVVTPSFSPSTGTYYTPQEVTITSTTEDAIIYYTTDGTDPDSTSATSTKYTAPITVSATTTLKAIAYKEGMTTSSIVNATYTFPAINEVATIAALREGLTDGTVYKLTGEAVITFMSTARNAKYIQDATAAILIDDNSGVITTTYNLYDGITGITGTIAEYSGMLQFTPVLDPGAATSQGNTITPREVTLAEIANYPAELVVIKRVNFEVQGNFEASRSYNLTDGTNTGVLRTNYNTVDYIGTAVPQGKLNISGVVLMYNTSGQLVARSLADFEAVSEPYITVAEESVPAMTTSGAPVTEEIHIEGNFLAGDITLAIAGNDATLFDVEPKIITPTDGTVASTTVTITYTPTVMGEHTATLTISSQDVDPIEFALTGKYILAAPVAIDATDITHNSFTANWEAVEAAEKYILNVYSQQSVFTADFNSLEGTGGNDGSWSGAVASNPLNTYEDWTLTKAYEGNNCVKVGTGSAQGIATTPALGLVGDAKLTFRAGAWNGNSESTTLLIELEGEGTLDLNSVTLAKGEFSSYEISITGATAETKISFKGENASNSRFFLDDVVVSNIGSITGSPFEVTETSFEVTGLEAETDYYYVVKAVAGDIESEISNEIKVTTTAAPAVPTIVITEVEIPEMTAIAGETDTEAINISGVNLTEDITIGIEGTDASLFSVDIDALTAVEGSVDVTTVTITFAPAEAGTYTATLTVSSAGAETKTFELKGTATPTVGLSDYTSDLSLYSNNGYVHFTTNTAGLNVEIYNSLGQSIYKGTSVEGLNSIRITDSIVIVKVGNSVNKIIVK